MEGYANMLLSVCNGFYTHQQALTHTKWQTYIQTNRRNHMRSKIYTNGSVETYTKMASNTGDAILQNIKMIQQRNCGTFTNGVARWHTNMVANIRYGLLEANKQTKA